MKIIQVIGGLGNQLFQYAYGFAYRLRNNEDIYYDISWYDNLDRSFGGLVKNRQLMLNYFNLELPVIDNQKLKDFKSNNKIPYKVIEKDLRFNPEYLRINNDKYIQGFFQNEKYFKEYKNELYECLKLKEPLDISNAKMIDKIKNCNSISLHIRRGDYLQLSNVYAQCTDTYYDKAIQYLNKKVKDPVYFIFSDDVQWIKSKFNATNYNVVDINNESNAYLDMILMSHCKHNIIANSSFSWWGAWLNKNMNKIVISPSRWFVQNDINIASEDWIRMDNG